MPATDCQGSSAAPLTHIGRSILSLRRDQAVHSMDNDNNASAHELEIESFQRKVSDRFFDLSSGPDEILSLAWVKKLLDLFLASQDEFRVILLNNKSQLHKAPMDRLIAEYFERSVKALDVCNAIRDGIEQIRQWQKLIEIVLVALDDQRMLGEGQIRRAKKALIDLAISMLDEKDSGTTLAHRNRSFGRNNTKDNHQNRSLGHFRSLSWSVSRSWSAARQLQAIGYNLYAPRGNEVVATNGLAGLVFTMSSVLLFVMWALVAAIPCQDRGLQVHFPMSRQFQWAGPMMVLHEKILEESKKRERRNACGLMREIYQIEKSTRLMNELLDSVQFPITEEKEGEVRQRVKEFSVVFETIKEGLDPLERQVRDVFHKIVRGRTEGLDCLGRIEN